MSSQNSPNNQNSPDGQSSRNNPDYDDLRFSVPRGYESYVTSAAPEQPAYNGETAYNRPGHAYNSNGTAYNRMPRPYDQAGPAYNGWNQGNGQSNDVFVQPNGGYVQPGTAYNRPNAAYNQPNTAYNQYQNAYGQWNAAPVYANAAYHNTNAAYHTNRKKLRAWQGILCFVLVMGIFYFVLPLPLYLLNVPEIPSILIQQLFLLGTSILFTVIAGADLREVFPVRKPTIIGVLGVFVIYIGTYLLENAVSYFLLYIAPDQLQEVSDSLFGGISGVEYVIYLILISVLPAVCEEALNRGVVLGGLKNDIRRRWVVILISGLLFGIGHYMPVRMIAPAILGFIMAWLVLETGNLFYSGLLHLLNNGLVLLISSVTQMLLPSEYLEEGITETVSVGGTEAGLAMMVYGLFAPLIIYSGCFIIRRCVHGPYVRFIEPGKERQAILMMTLPAAAVLFVGGMLMMLG